MCLDARIFSENIPLHSQTQSTHNSTRVDEIKHEDFCKLSSEFSKAH